MKRKHKNIDIQGISRYYELETSQIRSICRIEFNVAEFEDGMTKIGNFVYPFKMQAPIWLPQSLHLQTDTNSLRIRYQLEVCYEPLKYVVKKQDIFIFCPTVKSLPTPSKMD